MESSTPVLRSSYSRAPGMTVYGCSVGACRRHRDILKLLLEMMRAEQNGRVMDNMCAAICRMVWVNREILRLEYVSFLFLCVCFFVVFFKHALGTHWCYFFSYLSNKWVYVSDCASIFLFSFLVCVVLFCFAPLFFSFSFFFYHALETHWCYIF